MTTSDSCLELLDGCSTPEMVTTLSCSPRWMNELERVWSLELADAVPVVSGHRSGVPVLYYSAFECAPRVSPLQFPKEDKRLGHPNMYTSG